MTITIRTPDDQLVLLSVQEFSKLSGKSETVLHYMREAATGPAFLRIGRSVVYRREDVLEFLRGKSSNG